MKYVKENFYTLNWSSDIGFYIKEVEGYILELDGVLYGLARNDETTRHYVLTHIETGLKIGFEEYRNPKTLQGFISNLSYYNEKISNVSAEYINEALKRFTKTLDEVQINYNEYMQTLRNGWKYTVARVNTQRA